MIPTIYLDYQATTPIDSRVLEAMMPYMTTKFGNPHSAEHRYGWEAEAAVDIARNNVAAIIGAKESEIIFTSGATESVNLALKGVSEFYKKERKHIITCITEHKCALDSCSYLERNGFSVTYLPVNKDGMIDLNQLEQSIDERTLLVSIMMVNNEIGTIQDIKSIGDICRKKGVFFHSDAAQAFGKIPINVDELNIDLLSISGHKIYAPKGIGALYIRSRPKVRIAPLLHGGGQQYGLRAGTIATHQVVGLGKAASIAFEDMEKDLLHIRQLTSLFYKGLIEGVEEVNLNGCKKNRLDGNLNLSFPGIRGDKLILALKNLAISSGSACASASAQPSYVLKAIGLDEKQIASSVRFSIGRMTTRKEILDAVSYVVSAIKHLKDA